MMRRVGAFRAVGSVACEEAGANLSAELFITPAVLTGADYRGDGLGSLPSMAAYKRRGGGPMFLPPRPAIAFDRVMHIGYPVAVSAASLDQYLRGVGIIGF